MFYSNTTQVGMLYRNQNLIKRRTDIIPTIPTPTERKNDLISGSLIVPVPITETF